MTVIAKVFNYRIVKTIPLEQLEKFKEHDRMRVFYHKGVECVICKRKATQLAVGIDFTGSEHIDIYDDKFYPLTVDHIIPKSKGGTNDLENLQPMCAKCNFKKGNLMPEEIHEDFFKENSLDELGKDCGFKGIFKRVARLNKFLIGKRAYKERKSKKRFEHQGTIVSFYTDIETKKTRILLTYKGKQFSREAGCNIFVRF